MKTHMLTDITVDTWVQGEPLNMENLVGSVVLIEIFQVNCPGCFLYALPQAIQLHAQYQERGLVTLGLATAFEDYDKNTIENLRLLVETGEVIGETLNALNRQGMLTEGKLEWRLPFPVGMDRVVPDTEPITEERVEMYAHDVVPGLNKLPKDKQIVILDQVKHYLQQKTMKAETFERFELKGTPSSIVFDRKGQVRDISFGQATHLPSLIEQCLDETIR